MPCSGCGAWVDDWITWRRCDCQSMWIAWPPLRLTYTCFLGITRAAPGTGRLWRDGGHYRAYYFYCSRCVIQNRCNARQPIYINADEDATTDAELEEEITRVLERSTMDRFTWSRVPEPSTPAFSHEGTAREPIGISNLGAAEVGVGSQLVMLRSKFNMSVGVICTVVGETASQNSWQVANCYNRERLSVLKNHEDVSWRWVN